MSEGDTVTTGVPNLGRQSWGAEAALQRASAANHVSADRRLVIVSNRVAAENGKPDSGGLAVAIRATLDLSRRDFEEYYLGFANRVLWPLFHFRGSLVDYSRRDSAGYLRVNRRFARTLAPMLLPQDLVWIHDYHLIPLGRELRRLDHNQPIGFFLHTPFPPAELLRVLPNHRDLVEALCAYDVIGFQTKSDLLGFCDYLLRLAGAEDLGHGVLR